MSVTIEDKIELFSKVIFGNIEAQSSQKRQSIAETQDRELEKYEIEMRKKKKELMETAIAKAEREKTKLIAQAKNQQQHMLVDQKQRTMQKIMERLQALAIEYTSTIEYNEYMKKNIETALKTLDNSKQVTFYVMEKDLQLCANLLEKLIINAGKQVRYEIEKVAHNIIGGVIAEDMEELLELDLTLKALLEEHKDMVGAVVTRRFNEVSSL
jgi:V/A-type H+-transporting ATPase subunit E